MFNWIRTNKINICFFLGLLFIFVAGGYVESWQLMKTFILFTIGLIFSVMGIIFIFREEDKR